MKITLQDVTAGHVNYTLRRIDGCILTVVCRFLPWKKQLQLAREYADGANAGDVEPLVAAVCGEVNLTGCNVSDIFALEALVTQIVFGFEDPKAERESAPTAPLPTPPPSRAGTTNGATADSSSSAPLPPATPKRGSGASKGLPNSTDS